MYRNLAGQEYHVLLFDKDGRVKDQEAFISVKVSKDGGPYVPLADTAPSEIIGTGGRTGEYAFTLTAAESDYQFLDFELEYTGTVPGVEIAGIPANTVAPSRMLQIAEHLYGTIAFPVGRGTISAVATLSGRGPRTLLRGPDGAVLTAYGNDLLTAW